MTERNEPCPCGSGKKYKKCCIDKNELYNPENFIKQGQIKRCLLHDSNECSGPIINAHSIQNNKILNKIACDGHVTMIKANRGKVSIKKIGRNKATTFTGFCSKHDKSIFKPIEDFPIVCNAEQLFLLSYRAYAFEYHMKKQSNKSVDKVKDVKVKNKDFLEGYSEGTLYSLEQLRKYEKKYYDAFKKSNHSDFKSVVISIDEEIKFAVCSGTFLEYDLVGNRLNNMASRPSRGFRLLTINMLPVDRSSYITLTCYKEDYDFYSSFFDQVTNLSKKELVNFINNIVPAYFENVTYSPLIFKGMNEEQKSDFKEVYNNIFSVYDPIKRDLLKSTSYSVLPSFQKYQIDII